MARGSRSALTLAFGTALVAATPLGAAPAGPLTPPPPAPLQPPVPAPLLQAVPPAGAQRRGGGLLLNGRPQRAAWEWIDGTDGGPGQLWLPLEVLQNQLGFSSRSRSGGELDLEWFGRNLLVPTAAQRSLADEVAVDVAPVLRAIGVQTAVRGDTLELRLPPPRLLQVRRSGSAGSRRVVLDLEGPALVRAGDAGPLVLAITAGADQLPLLKELGLQGRQGAGELTLLSGAPPRRVFTLGGPARVVIDLPADATATGPGGGQEPAQPRIDPRLQALLGPQLQWDRRTLPLGSGRVRINAVRLDPRTSALSLRPLSRAAGMEGLSSLGQLARERDALVAINGGYFNRVRRLPLGALREDGRWRSGPILGRGAIGWEARSLPRFGRLSLRESLIDRDGREWPLLTVNSGWVQRGLSRYTADWGPWYRALSSGETGLLLRDGVVSERIDPARLAAGVALRPGDMLVVARAGAVLPAAEGDTLSLRSVPSDPLGQASNVMGGGPLLLQDGRFVLNGSQEGFAAAFLSQGAPRTVIGSDGVRVWLITLEGVDDAGPTLAETANLLLGLGVRDALNLDGGSSTGLVMGGVHTVKGRGVAGSVHNGLGLVPEPAGTATGNRAGT
ncbi:MAG: phosphodiester glycosidase family protein [Cyanobium sp.]